MSSNHRIDVWEIAGLLVRDWRTIAATIGAGTLVGVLLSFILPEYYRCTMTILPETDRTRVGMSATLSDLAAMAGVTSGGEISLIRLYPAILKSEAVLRPVILERRATRVLADSGDLIRIWEIDTPQPERAYELALKKMRNELEVGQENRTGLVSLSLEMKDPHLCADVLNSIGRSMDEFVRTKRKSNASEQRLWIAARLEEVERDLREAEESLRIFREANRAITGSPRLTLQQERLQRTVLMNSTLFAELKRQYEIARIEEVKNVPVINIMDAARVPAKREKPQRALIVLAFAFFSTLLAVLIVAGRTVYRERLASWWGQVKHVFTP